MCDEIKENMLVMDEKRRKLRREISALENGNSTTEKYRPKIKND